DRAKVPVDQAANQAVRVAAAAAEVLEVDLVVLDAADRERQVDLERADVGIDLVGGARVDTVELPQDLVALVDVSLVQLVVRLDRGARDPVQLVELRLQLSGRDLLELEGERRHPLLPSDVCIHSHHSYLDWPGRRSISSPENRERSDR